MSTGNPFEPGEFGTEAPEQGGHREAVPLDLGAVLTRSWELVAENPGVALGAAFIPVGLGIVLGVPLGVAEAGFDLWLESSDQGDSAVALAGAFGFLALRLVLQLITFFLALGVVRIFVNLAFGREAELGMLVGEGRHLLAGILAQLVVGVGVVFGLVLLIVPGLILALGWQFTLYALIDQELGPISALKESWRLTDGYKGTLFVFAIVFGVVFLVVTCATCGIGYLLALPIMQVIQAVLYHSLLDLKGPAERY